MLDSDLAEYVRAPTKALNQAVRRNLENRFPGDFMFRLTAEEAVPETPRPAGVALCLHRARCGHALIGAQEQTRGANEHCHHPGV